MVNKKLINLDRANQAMPSGPPTHAVQQKTTNYTRKIGLGVGVSISSIICIIYNYSSRDYDRENGWSWKLDCSRSPSDFLSFCLKINVVVIVV